MLLPLILQSATIIVANTAVLICRSLSTMVCIPLTRRQRHHFRSVTALPKYVKDYTVSYAVVCVLANTAFKLNQQNPSLKSVCLQLLDCLLAHR